MDNIPPIDATEFEDLFKYVGARAGVENAVGLSSAQIISQISDAISERYPDPEIRTPMLFRWIALHRLAWKGLLSPEYYRRGDAATADWFDRQAIRLAAHFPLPTSGRFDAKPFLESLQQEAL
jgi:hypothetical protein